MIQFQILAVLPHLIVTCRMMQNESELTMMSANFPTNAVPFHGPQIFQCVQIGIGIGKTFGQFVAGFPEKCFSLTLWKPK